MTRLRLALDYLQRFPGNDRQLYMRRKAFLTNQLRWATMRASQTSR
jgi:hypothetical protein